MLAGKFADALTIGIGVGEHNRDSYVVVYELLKKLTGQPGRRSKNSRDRSFSVRMRPSDSIQASRASEISPKDLIERPASEATTTLLS